MDMFELLVNTILTRAGLDPARRYGPHHGAPASMWAAVALMVAIAVALPVLGVIFGE